MVLKNDASEFHTSRLLVQLRLKSIAVYFCEDTLCRLRKQNG